MFIKDRDGIVRPWSTIATLRRKRDPTRYFGFTRDRKRFECSDFDLQQFQPIIPATPGYHAVIAFDCFDDFGELTLLTLPVIGWRSEGGDFMGPVVPQFNHFLMMYREAPGQITDGIILPNNRVLVFSDPIPEVLANIGEFREHAKEILEWRAEKDRRLSPHIADKVAEDDFDFG